MSGDSKRFLAALWAGVALQVGGRVLDGIWHANHDEFEGASQQLEAHWLLWLGVALTLVVVIAAFARLPAPARNAGWTVVLLGLALYIFVSVWHFIEHANRSDPELAHILLAVGQLAIFAGVVAATLLARRGPRAPKAAPG